MADTRANGTGSGANDTGGNLGVPAAGKAIAGDLAGQGILIDCPVIRHELWWHGERYLYLGCSQGVAIYKTPQEIRELDDEQANRSECNE